MYALYAAFLFWPSICPPHTRGNSVQVLMRGSRGGQGVRTSSLKNHKNEVAHFILLLMLKRLFTYAQPKRFKLCSCQKMCHALHYLFGNIFIRSGSKLCRQIVGIPMVTNCAPLVADLFRYERDFMLSLSDNNQTNIIEAFNSNSRYLDDLLNIDFPYFEKNGRSDISYLTSVKLMRILLILKLHFWT